MSCASAGFALPVNSASSDDSIGSYHSCCVVAGVEGFEPSYDGIKTRCLTTWRHPNDSNQQSVQFQHAVQRRATQSPRYKAVPPVWNSRRDSLRIHFAFKAGED